jgi:hypothetical protein
VFYQGIQETLEGTEKCRLDINETENPVAERIYIGDGDKEMTPAMQRSSVRRVRKLSISTCR